MQLRTIIAAAALGLAATACMDEGGFGGANRPGIGPGQLSGTVAYRERMALPPTSVVEVSIVEAGRQDAASRLIARKRIAARGKQVPIPFTLRYRGDHRGRAADYIVQARITDGRGRLLFITDSRYPLPRDGRIDLLLVNARR
ncbi:MAG: hypothetical protein ABS87_12710 [Sphingomonas sp. SCN 67-18]|uniref:YbaY family lipoprotein n=1 Tax=uncultured Sphingomonas sp. TaxID=158754 RepID=UPI00086CA795|nr:YbaY family lipoprotein [Sphingomonas sp. SCN 67-18]ODU19918.1 MAG: hypothetical protein ABS87_12710 [Sphingomonas sp. SCN 67-18]